MSWRKLLAAVADRHPPSSSSATEDGQWLLDEVDEALRRFMVCKANRWIEPSPRKVFEALQDFVCRPGKRVRSQLCYWGWAAAGGYARDPRIAEVAAALEMLHAWALIHDDIMDNSDLRRGAPSLHLSLAWSHETGWRGDAGRFGTNLGILCGDLCLVWADEMFHTSGFPPEMLAVSNMRLAAMRTDMCIGQFLDLREQADGGSLGGALQVIAYKTARYTVQGPLQIGGALAGAGPELMTCYQVLGSAVGEAFQLRDDVLGVFGDPTVTGKSNLDDLRDGKPTVLMAFARQHATAGQDQQIQALHGNPGLNAEDATVLRRIIEQTGARERVEELIAQRKVVAQQALARAQMPGNARQALNQMIDFATQRQR